MNNIKRHLTWTTLASMSILVAGELMHDVAKKHAPGIPVIFPLNATVSTSHKLCWPNITELWKDFLYSRSNTSKNLNETLHLKRESIERQFHDHIIQIVTHMGKIRNLANENSSQSTPSVRPIQIPLCWPRISIEFWQKHLHFSRDSTMKHLIRLRSRYLELSQNFTSQMIQIIRTVDKIGDLVHYFIDEEEGMEAALQNGDQNYTVVDMREKDEIFELETTTKGDERGSKSNMHFQTYECLVKKESFLRSAIVPILGLVIAALLICIAILCRRLRNVRYRDAPLLQEEEIMSHFFGPRITGY